MEAKYTKYRMQRIPEVFHYLAICKVNWTLEDTFNMDFICNKDIWPEVLSEVPAQCHRP